MPSRRPRSRDRAAEKIADAQKAALSKDWAGAVELYSEALALLPNDDLKTRYQLRLAQANARICTGELPEAKADLETLLADAQKNHAPAALVDEVRASLASAEYYAGWLMRLEGAATEEWMAETESARQHFRLLAEKTQAHGTKALATDYQKNLESVIRLELMDLSELKGLPLPKQCQNCSNCSGKCRKQRESNCKNPGNKAGDVREKISEQKQQGAGKSGREGSGS
jgi:tetratricopeptide (TPR) repeat protein